MILLVSTHPVVLWPWTSVQSNRNGGPISHVDKAGAGTKRCPQEVEGPSGGRHRPPFGSLQQRGAGLRTLLAPRGALSEAADIPATQGRASLPGPGRAPRTSHPPAFGPAHLPTHGTQGQKACAQCATSLWHSSQPLYTAGYLPRPGELGLPLRPLGRTLSRNCPCTRSGPGGKQGLCLCHRQPSAEQPTQEGSP